MTNIIGITGSLRKGSYNTALLRAAAHLMPTGATLEVAGINGIPLYDGDVEAEKGIPETVAALKEKVMSAPGLLLATPEYNNSLPGPLKNAIDWLSRPPADIPKVFGGRAVGVMGATPGGFGTVLAQSAWLPVWRTLGTRPWFGARMQVPKANKVFNDAGELVDEETRERLRAYLNGFVEFVAKST